MAHRSGDGRNPSRRADQRRRLCSGLPPWRRRSLRHNRRCRPRQSSPRGPAIQHTGIFDNANSLWQANMSMDMRPSATGWPRSASRLLPGQVARVTTSTRSRKRSKRRSYYRKIIDLTSKISSGSATSTTAPSAATPTTRRPPPSSSAGCAPRQALRAAGKPWYLAVNFVNPHDVMFVNSDLRIRRSGQVSFDADRPPASRRIYRATWDEVPLPATRGQLFDAPGRPRGQKIIRGAGRPGRRMADEDRRWRLLRNYYRCIATATRSRARTHSLKASSMDKNTIIVFTADHSELGNISARQELHLPPAEPPAADDRPSRLSRRQDLQGGDLAGRPGADAVGAHRGRPRGAETGGNRPRGAQLLRLLGAPDQASFDSLRPASLLLQHAVFRTPDGAGDGRSCRMKRRRW